MPMQKPAKARSAEEEIIEITDSEEEEPLRIAIEARSESQPSDGFGKLLDCLLHGGPQPQDTSGYLEETKELKSLPITSGSAVPPESLLLQHADSSFSEGDSEGYESHNTYVASGDDSEWGMGDDERATRMDFDEEEEPEREPDDEGKILLPPDSQEDGDQEGYSCPLCACDLSEFDEQVRSQNSHGSVGELDLTDIREVYVTPCEQVYRHHVPVDLDFQASKCPVKIPQQTVPAAVILSHTQPVKPCTYTRRGSPEPAGTE